MDCNSTLFCHTKHPQYFFSKSDWQADKPDWILVMVRLMLLSDITGCDCMYLESSTWAAGCCSCCIWNLLLPSSKLMWVSALYVSFGFSYHRPSLLFTLMLIPIWLYASNCCMRRSMATASCPRCWVDVAGLHITFQVIIVNAGMEPIASFPHRTSFGIRSFSIRLTSTKPSQAPVTEQGEHAGHPFPLVPERHSTGKRPCQLMPCILLMAAHMERVESACLSRSRGPGYTAVHECVEYTSPVFCNLGVWS